MVYRKVESEPLVEAEFVRHYNVSMLEDTPSIALGSQG